MGLEKDNKTQDLTIGDNVAASPQFSASTISTTPQDNISLDSTKKSQQKSNAVPKDEVAKLIEKARMEEKEKVYSTIETLRATKADGDAKVEALEKKLQAAQEEAEGLRTGKLQETDSFNRELRELKETNQKLEKAIELVASESAARLQAAQMETFREKEIRKAGIKSLSKYVSGTNKEEILDSIKKIKKEENDIYEAAKLEARKALAAELPSPIAPDGATGRGPNNAVTPDQREGLARLKGDAYLKERQRLLLEAKQKAGLA